MKKFLIFLISVIILLQGSIIAFAEGNTIKNGDIIEFGNYPQTVVTDNKLVQELDKVQKEWKSYNYCYSKLVPSDKEDVDFEVVKDDHPSDYMQYSDFSYNGVNYRGVNFVCPSAISSSMHWPDDEIYPDLTHGEFNGIYYFKYEPISWIVVDAENGIVVSQKALDQQEFNKSYYFDSETDYYYSDNSETNYANDYSESTLRKWLNNDFLSTAFTAQQKEIIAEKEYILDEYHFMLESYWPTGVIVNDKISIASSSELREYAFSPVAATDYAAIQGSQTKLLLTRTVFDKIIDEGGNAEAIRMDNFKGHSMSFVGNVGGCVVPVMKLKNLTNDNSMNIYNSGKHCGCVCHNLHHSNNFFGEFIYKIIRTFWDWFSTSKYCDCGLRHY